MPFTFLRWPFWGLFFLTAFWFSLWHLSFIIVGGQDNLTYILLSFFFSIPLLFAITFLKQSPHFLISVLGKIIQIFTAILLGILSGAVYYCLTIKNRITDDILGAFIQTNREEFIDFFTDGFITPKMALIVFSTIAFALFILIFFSRLLPASFQNYRPKQRIIFFICLLAIAFTTPNIQIIKRYTNFKAQYTLAVEEYKQITQLLKTAPLYKAEKREKGELYVIVIGESAGRDRMQTYGGGALNTPWLQSLQNKPGWATFSNAYSTHTHTIPALLGALTQKNSYNDLPSFPNAPTIIGISRAANIQTTWISNQMRISVYDNPITAIAESAHQTIFANESLRLESDKILPDESLLSALDAYLENIDIEENNLLIIHLMGSHSPYKKRYPASFPTTENISTGYIGNYTKKTAHVKKLMEYETSIAYTDAVLQKIFEKIQNITNKPSAFIYFSDHGEFPNKEGHNSDKFSWPMARIPFFLWLSPTYQQEYPQKLQALQKNAHKIFTNDLIFDLYAGLSSISLENKNSLFDISHEKYSLTVDNAHIMNGLHKVKNDPAQRAQNNLAYFEDKLPQIILHRKNTLYSAAEVQTVGAKKIEVDLLLRETPQGKKLLLGHDDKKLTDIDLETFLQHPTVQKMEFIWFDLKELNAASAQEIFTIFETLDAQLKIKNRCFIETPDPQGIPLFVQAGWQTSCYLPWEEIKRIYESEETEAGKAFIANLIKNIQTSKFSGISYDLKANDAVQALLYPKLKNTVFYHTWTTHWKITDEDFIQKASLLQNITTLLVKFNSDFHY